MTLKARAGIKRPFAASTLPGSARGGQPSRELEICEPLSESRSPAARFGYAIALLKNRLRLPGVSVGPKAFSHLIPHRSTLLGLLSETVVSGHNNSVLLLGPHGTGKSMLLEDVLEELMTTHGGRISVVRLHGLLHADDAIAFKEIARQLCLQNGGAFSNKWSFCDSLELLKDMLRELSDLKACAIFVLDDLEKFATHSRQPLLYNLVDALHSRNVRAAVVGVSTHVDGVTEAMEKRVRSRFSARCLVFTPPPLPGKVLLQEALSLPPPPLVSDHIFGRRFNDTIGNILNRPDVKTRLEQFLMLENDTRAIYNLARSILNHTDDSKATWDADAVVAALGETCAVEPTMAEDLVMASELSLPELFLLVAVKRVADKGKTCITFAMAHDEYELWCRNNSNVTFPRAICLRAFDVLLAKGLLAHASAAGSRRGDVSQREFCPVELLVTADQIDAALQKNPNSTAVLRDWFKRLAVDPNNAGSRGGWPHATLSCSARSCGQQGRLATLSNVEIRQACVVTDVLCRQDCTLRQQSKSAALPFIGLPSGELGEGRAIDVHTVVMLPGNSKETLQCRPNDVVDVYLGTLINSCHQYTESVNRIGPELYPAIRRGLPPSMVHLATKKVLRGGQVPIAANVSSLHFGM
eukprot:jgi/Mesvir1/20677/Mv14890-RA.1